MGRMTVPAKADTGLEITVGWDRPLETYFATVLRPGEEEDQVLAWLGTSIGEITDANQILAAIAPHADVDESLSSRLEKDRRANIGKADSPHQAEIKRLLVR